jgi:hypothetical protein
MTGRLCGASAIDYFIFTPGLWPYIPPFAVGRFTWDNWLVGNALEQGKKVVDATRFIKCIHQNHEYKRDQSSDALWNGPEARRNLIYAGHFLVGTMDHAPLFFDENAVIKRDGFRTLKLWKDLIIITLKRQRIYRIYKKLRYG